MPRKSLRAARVSTNRNRSVARFCIESNLAMRIVGELCLLTAFVASGFAAFACIAGERLRSANVARVGLFAMLFALLGPLELAFLSPSSFALMGPGHWWYGRWTERRRDAFVARAEAAAGVS